MLIYLLHPLFQITTNVLGGEHPRRNIQILRFEFQYFASSGVFYSPGQCVNCDSLDARYRVIV